MQTERELWHRECDATIATLEQTISELKDSARFLTDGIDELIRERDAHERKRDVAEARLAALTAERDEALRWYQDARAAYDAAAHDCNEARAARDGSEGVILAVIDAIGGTVEGAPTHRINFLQRVRALVKNEAALTAALEKYGRHDRLCHSQWTMKLPGPCTCGFDAARGV